MKNLIAEGKTKKIFGLPDDSLVTVFSKDDITAGDGAKHDVMEGKAAFANRTTCNVFSLLKACGIPLAFQKQLTPVSFEALKCTMLPYEVVVRRESDGSHNDRNPHLPKGRHFPKLVVELFLKTKHKVWKEVKSGIEYPLVKDDPLMTIDYIRGKADLYFPGYTSEERRQNPPKGALVGQKPFLTLYLSDVFTRPDEKDIIEQMQGIARQTFLILEKAWQLQGRKLVDFKVEFGIGPSGELLLADVIDNDSWRVVADSGGYIDKQVYRDGGDLNTVTAKYRQVAELTAQFALPSQRLILWRGSDKDNLKPFYDTLAKSLPRSQLEVMDVTCSVHKQPALAYKLLQQRVSEVPDTVIIAYVGKSNGAGPTLSANTAVPVITVPAGWEKFPDDVWSSLRTPSNVPVMTVLDPANAMLAALQIFAMRHPGIYAALRFDQEKRLIEI